VFAVFLRSAEPLRSLLVDGSAPLAIALTPCYIYRRGYSATSRPLRYCGTSIGPAGAAALLKGSVFSGPKVHVEIALSYGSVRTSSEAVTAP
jgi:hypothetical protein